MTRDIWFISDTHFGHERLATRVRGFASVDEMDAAIADAWRARVKPEDLIYHLGDIAWNAGGVSLFVELPGTKRLILGNHDDGRKLAPHVQRLQLFHRFSEHEFIATHMPMMMEREREPINVHGHVHATDVNFPGYVNISVEKTGYAPLHLDELLVRVKAEKTKVDAFLAERRGES
jgi:calcineurin-like phosphoesterase family protein